MNENYRKAKIIEQANKKRLLEVNPNLDEKSGIYFLTRIDENDIKYAYVGQAKTRILTRLAQHLVGYQQHIDLSLRKHGLYSAANPYGWKIDFKHFSAAELDEKERYYIILYARNGYQLRNKDTGGGAGKQELGERKPPKTYRQGIKAGKKALAMELSAIINKHLTVKLKDEKQGNKVSQKQLEKFNQLLDEYNQYE